MPHPGGHAPLPCKTPSRSRYVNTALFLLLLAVVGIGVWRITVQPSARLVAVVRRPEGMMGTNCTLAAVVPPAESERGVAALREAETILRQSESRMSRWIDSTQVSRLNQAGAGVSMPLSDDVLEVLRLARDAARDTGGAFDATCRPLVELWREAAKRNRLPTDDEIRAARRRSRWDDFRLSASSAEKATATASVDLDGIATGYAVDRAMTAIRAAHPEGGMIDVGGDMACFGRPPKGRFWQVDVQDPFGPERLTTLRLTDVAVCTSGDYAKFGLIQGRRYSHIIDPRAGRPARLVPSVTIVAPTAVIADIWSTALSVLGPKGIERLPDDVEAILIVGAAKDYKVYCTPGILDHLDRPLPVEPIVIQPNGERKLLHVSQYEDATPHRRGRDSGE
ncbi:MAG TPA: FAD:protein FMN transferase [Thermoguttaceae bacterium]|nr:FAD:protein FMN transferase [Thermoguttaceae bacterium]